MLESTLLSAKLAENSRIEPTLMNFALSTNVRMDKNEPPVSSFRLLLRLINAWPSEDGSRQ